MIDLEFPQEGNEIPLPVPDPARAEEEVTDTPGRDYYVRKHRCGIDCFVKSRVLRVLSVQFVKQCNACNQPPQGSHDARSIAAELLFTAMNLVLAATNNPWC